MPTGGVTDTELDVVDIPLYVATTVVSAEQVADAPETHVPEYDGVPLLHDAVNVTLCPELIDGSRGVIEPATSNATAGPCVALALTVPISAVSPLWVMLLYCIHKVPENLVPIVLLLMKSIR